MNESRNRAGESEIPLDRDSTLTGINTKIRRNVTEEVAGINPIEYGVKVTVDTNNKLVDFFQQPTNRKDISTLNTFIASYLPNGPKCLAAESVRAGSVSDGSSADEDLVAAMTGSRNQGGQVASSAGASTSFGQTTSGSGSHTVSSNLDKKRAREPDNPDGGHSGTPAKRGRRDSSAGAFHPVYLPQRGLSLPGLSVNSLPDADQGDEYHAAGGDEQPQGSSKGPSGTGYAASLLPGVPAQPDQGSQVDLGDPGRLYPDAGTSPIYGEHRLVHNRETYEEHRRRVPFPPDDLAGALASQERFLVDETVNRKYVPVTFYKNGAIIIDHESLDNAIANGTRTVDSTVPNLGPAMGMFTPSFLPGGYGGEGADPQTSMPYQMGFMLSNPYARTSQDSTQGPGFYVPPPLSSAELMAGLGWSAPRVTPAAEDERGRGGAPVRGRRFEDPEAPGPSQDQEGPFNLPGLSSSALEAQRGYGGHPTQPHGGAGAASGRSTPESGR